MYLVFPTQMVCCENWYTYSTPYSYCTIFTKEGKRKVNDGMEAAQEKSQLSHSGYMKYVMTNMVSRSQLPSKKRDTKPSSSSLPYTLAFFRRSNNTTKELWHSSGRRKGRRDVHPRSFQSFG